MRSPCRFPQHFEYVKEVFLSVTDWNKVSDVMQMERLEADPSVPVPSFLRLKQLL
jgi:hypothetical protein